MGFEPTTPTLARLCSTPELRPLLPRSTAARRIWRKAKLNARLIPATAAREERTQCAIRRKAPADGLRWPQMASDGIVYRRTIR